jgi:hypothetical protein
VCMGSVVELSIYDASRPSSGDSKPTEKTKERLKVWITELFNKRGFRVWVKEEIPYISDDGDPRPYHLDLGVLTRNREMTDIYSFFGIELDWDTGHRSRINDRKDENKDKAFHKIGVPILRIDMEDVYGKKALSEYDRNDKIWSFFIHPRLDEFGQMNTELAIRLKENAWTTCPNPKCKHKASDHHLGGCNFRFTNKAAMYCPCSEPFFTSDI